MPQFLASTRDARQPGVELLGADTAAGLAQDQPRRVVEVDERQQVRAHEGAITVFTLSQGVLEDPGLAAFAERTLPVLRAQLEEARALAGSM